MSCNLSFYAHLNFELPIKYPNGDIKYTVNTSLKFGGEGRGWKCKFKNHLPRNGT